MKVTNDLLRSLDHGNVSLLTLLDLSAAFDAIDHTILLHRLDQVFGIHDTALFVFLFLNPVPFKPNVTRDLPTYNPSWRKCL